MENKIYPALGKIMAGCTAIAKEQENTQQKFKFRGIDDFMNTLHGLFAKHGVIIVPSELEHIQEPITYMSNGYEKIQFRSRVHLNFKFVSTEDGSFVESDGWGEAADNGDKGYNKCKSIALKYVLMQMFLVPTADIADPDKDTPDEITVNAGKKPSKRTVKEPIEQSAASPLREALGAIEATKSRKELEDVYRQYKEALKDNTEFLTALNQKAKCYQKTN